MIKYVIQSGGMARHPDKMQDYFSELFKNAGNNPSILWCYFSAPEADRDEEHAFYNPIFKPAVPGNLNICEEVATLADFEEQVKSANIVYFQGGDWSICMENFKRWPNFEDLLDGKNVGVSSASALVLATHGWSCDKRMTMDGLGIWPAKVGVHFYSNYGADDPRGPIDWEAAKAELEIYGDTSLPVHTLKEGEFVVLNK